MFSASKTFMKTYGTVGISVYGGVTAVSIGSIYLVLRSSSGTSDADAMITTPLERLLGSDSATVQTIKQQLGKANQQQQQQQQQQHQASSSGSSSSSSDKEGRSLLQQNGSNNNSDGGINYVRELSYLGIASVIDSLALPVKLAICLPIAKSIISRRRGGRG